MNTELRRSLQASGSASAVDERVLASSRIDTHHHILPPQYASWLLSRGITDGDKPLPKWTLEGALDLMKENGIAASILSVSTPGVYLDADADVRGMARAVNEFAADIVGRYPKQFGFLATLPLPDLEGALDETTYAFDTLRADGVILLSNTGGTYLGDASWDPLMAELNSRGATVLVHPCALPGVEVPGIPAYAADFLLDTTRAAINIAKSGCLERFPNLRIILSHAGGFLPYAAHRFARLCSSDGSAEGGIGRLRKFYFDTALSSTPYTLPSLLSFAESTHITFGSDWPFAAKESSAHYRRLLDDFPLTDAQRFAIARGNAQALFPRFA